MDDLLEILFGLFIGLVVVVGLVFLLAGLDELIKLVFGYGDVP